MGVASSKVQGNRKESRGSCALFERNLLRPVERRQKTWTMQGGRSGEDVEEEGGDEKQVGGNRRPVQSTLWTDTGRTDQKLVSPASTLRITNVGT